MGLLESVTHKEEIQKLLTHATAIYDDAKDKLESQQKKTAKTLEKLGKVRINIWAKNMSPIVNTYNSFTDTNVFRNISTNTVLAGQSEAPDQVMSNMNNATMTMREISEVGIASLGAGALMGIASYGGAMMFGRASTGAAISSLSGAAKHNATLAWLGGGALKNGGAGMLGGSLVLAGIVIAPLIAVASCLNGAQRLEEAKATHAKAVNAATQFNRITAALLDIEQTASKYISRITKFNKQCKPFISELNRISATYSNLNNSDIDYNSMSLPEQKMMALSWKISQINYQLLSTPILNDNGEVSFEAKIVLKSTEMQIKQIKKDMHQLANEYHPLKDLIWKPKARNALILNFVIIFFLLAAGSSYIITDFVLGLGCFLSCIIAFPIFFIKKDLQPKELYFARIGRAILAIVFVLLLNQLNTWLFFIF